MKMAMDPPPLQYPHFFQPLLPGFDTHLTIPVAFFSKYIEGKHDQNTAKLTSAASDMTWEVTIDGRRLTGGWKDFVAAHDLRIGDIVIFKHEGDMVFHVSALGPSCCEIQYTQPNSIKEENNSDDDNENQHEIRNVSREENALSNDYCFVVEVTDSDLKLDKLQLPYEAARSIALKRRKYPKIKVVNEEGISWDLRLSSTGGCYCIKGGWKSFCRANRHRVGDLITFNLVGDENTTPLLCICPEEKCVGLINEYKSKEREGKNKQKRVWLPSSSARKNRFVTITLTRYNFQNSKLLLPTTFVRFNRIDEHKTIVLMDKHGGKRLVKLIQDGPRLGRKGLGKGWKLFCEANDVLIPGESFVLELIWEDSAPVLKFCHQVKNKEPICV